jgi:hypothetical protein
MATAVLLLPLLLFLMVLARCGLVLLMAACLCALTPVALVSWILLAGGPSSQREA